MRLIHCVCWLVPISLAAMVRTVSKYSRSGQGISTCVQNSTPISKIYHNVCYYGLLYACFFSMLCLFLKIFTAEWYGDPNVTSNAFKVAKNALRWYPFLFIVFWAPHSISSFIYFNGSRGEYLFRFFLIWKVLHGLATAVIFITQSKEARILWWKNTVLRIFPHLDDAAEESTWQTSDSIVDIRITEMSSFSITAQLAGSGTINPVYTGRQMTNSSV